MMPFYAFVESAKEFLPLAATLLAMVVAFLAFNIFLKVVKKRLLKLAKTKKQVSNIEIFSTTIKYAFVLLLVISAIFYYSGDLTGFGITLGLLSAAIGFALQKPIAGIAAWVMIVTRRPFEIGDRIIIGSVKGDVVDISLTHIMLREIGGLIATEENSGRTIIVPNNILFEQNIVNYTQWDEMVLTQVEISITYESDLEKAVKVCLESAKKVLEEFLESPKKEPYVRSYFQASGINLSTRFFVPAKRVTEISSAITGEIFHRIRKEKKVAFAYPHTQVVMDRREGFRQAAKV